MGKYFLFFALSLFTLTVIVGFIRKKPTKIFSEKIKNSLIECAPYYDYNPISKAFLPTQNPTILTRKNIMGLSSAESTNFYNAIYAMQHTVQPSPNTNSNMTIWKFQVAMHEGHPSTNPNFGSYVHGKLFFLAWHRMYIYFFERIMRRYMPVGDAMGLPYWNYQSYGMIPPMFRNAFTNNVVNTLYNTTRNRNMTNGGSLPSFTPTGQTRSSTIDFQIKRALSKPNFYPFQLTLEDALGGVHQAVGGNMYNARTAAEDPLFYIHHANIDRLWQVWLNKGEGRCNPTKFSDEKWWKTSYNFYDENGAVVSITGEMIVNITNNLLPYKYDSVGTSPVQKTCNNLKKSVYDTKKKATFKVTVSNTLIQNRITIIKFPLLTPKMVDSIKLSKNHGKLDVYNKEGSDAVYVEFEDVKVNKIPEGVVEVYIYPKSITNPSPNDIGFAGLLDLFTATASNSHSNGHEEEIKPNLLRININYVVKEKYMSLLALSQMQLVFVVRGNDLKNKEVLTKADITIGKTSLAIYNETD